MRHTRRRVMPSAGGHQVREKSGTRETGNRSGRLCWVSKSNLFTGQKNTEQRRTLIGKKNMTCNCAGSRAGIRTRYVLNG